jgi:hypothetical protein
MSASKAIGRTRCEVCGFARSADPEKPCRRCEYTVPNDPFRARYRYLTEETELKTASQIARELNWLCSHTHASSRGRDGSTGQYRYRRTEPDVSRLRRTLGLTADRQRRISHHVAMQLLGPLELDPYEVGL